MKVLVADDDPVLRRLVQHVVATSGYEPVLAATGTEAWEILLGPDAPPVAVLDWVMPGLTGPDICRRVRERPEPLAAYLLVLTSRGETEDVVTALQAGADDYITKPFQPDELRARVAVGARLASLQRQLADRVTALQEALAHVQQLQGLLPMCAWCKQVRNDKNFWERVETYFAARSEVRFTHSICPPCRERLSAQLTEPDSR
jgi:DNA-binding response OmpR family regulator